MSSRTGNYALLRPGTFANNLLSWSFAIRSRLPVRGPYLDSAQPPVHEADVAEAAAHLLTHDVPKGAAYPLTGPQSLTRRQQIETIARAIGRPVEAQEISEDEFRQEFGPYLPDGIATMLLDYWRDTVTEPDTPRPLEAITGRPGRSLAQWAADHKLDFSG